VKNPIGTDPEIAVTVERLGHVLLIGLNRPAKRNAFNLAMIDQLAAAYYRLENDDEVRCGVLFAHGDHFTGGLDLAEVGPLIRENVLDFSAPGRSDPWRKDNIWTTPLVAAVRWSRRQPVIAISKPCGAATGMSVTRARLPRLTTPNTDERTTALGAGVDRRAVRERGVAEGL
jgi:enoyl-CoA hydratase/carnithine racemase